MIKQIILDILDYLRYQVANDRCTPEELRSLYTTLGNTMHIDATVGHYGQSTSNVRNIIARNNVGKPKRRVYYNLMEFIKHIPKSWHSK